MSGCHYSGNVAFAPYPGTACQCPCHTGGVLWKVGLCCECKRNYSPPQPTIQIVSDNTVKTELTILKIEIDSLKKELKKLEELLKPVLEWKKTAKILCDQSKKPHKCPVCESKGVEFDRLNRDEGFNKKCNSCEGKGIIWG